MQININELKIKIVENASIKSWNCWYYTYKSIENLYKTYNI